MISIPLRLKCWPECLTAVLAVQTLHLSKRDQSPSYELRLWGKRTEVLVREIADKTKFRTPLLRLGLEYLTIQQAMKKSGVDLQTRRILRSKYTDAFLTTKAAIYEDLG